MDIINIAIIALFTVFLIFEGKDAILRYRSHFSAARQMMQTKQNVTVCKDYTLITVAYAVVIAFLVVYGVIYMKEGNMLYGIIFLLLSVFCVVFILEAIVLKTIVFYESGFLYSGKTYKYKNILKVDENKKFVKGYQVKLMGEDEIYISKKTKAVMEAKLSEFKNRKKNRV